MAEQKKLRVTQVKSAIGRKYDQEQTLKSLGLGRIGKTHEIVDNESVRGMIFKVKHLIKVEELESSDCLAAIGIGRRCG